MGYNTKNYTEQGGEKTVIGGTLEFKPGASIIGVPFPDLTPATETVLGGIKAEAKTEADTVPVKIDEEGFLFIPVLENQMASTAEDVEALVTDFNKLLTKLKAAGLMVSD